MVSSTTTALHSLGAGELAGMIRSREVSSREVIESLLDRIAQVSPTVNALTVVLGEQALAAADVADRAVAAGNELGPLHGVPFTVKENIDLAGSATSQGVPVLAGADPARMRHRSRACGPPVRSRWHARTCPILRCAGTPTMRCAAQPETRGTLAARPAARAVARASPWPPG